MTTDRRPSRGFSLATKLIAATGLLLAAAVGTSGYYSFRSLNALARSETGHRREDGEAAMKAQADLLVRNVASSAALPLAEGNFTYLSSLVTTALKEDQRIEWLLIYDEGSERVVARTDGATGEYGGDRLADALVQPLRDQQQSMAKVLESRDAQDPTRFVFGANVLVKDRVVGQIRLGLSTRDLEEALARSIASASQRARDSARKQAAVAVGILLLGIVLCAVQGLRITRPLHALSRQASLIAGGDFAQRVQVGARDEIGHLGDSFNSMAESLGVLLTEMAGKAALERELANARSVQELMSPSPALVTVGPFSLAGHCETATQCGGDWWTYRELSGGRLLIVVGDVTGHGMPAAMIAATARGAVESLAIVDDADLTPVRVLTAIDGAVRDVGGGRLLMTCFALVLDSRSNTIRFANAGHTFPYIGRLTPEGKLGELTVLAANGNPLGNPVPSYKEGRERLSPNQVIVLSTDGLTDRLAASGDRFGDRRLRKLLLSSSIGTDDASVTALRDDIITKINTFAGTHPSDDDMTLVVCRFSTEARAALPSRQGNVA